MLRGGSHGRAHARVRPDIFSVPRTAVYGHLDQNTVGSRPGALTSTYATGQ